MKHSVTPEIFLDDTLADRLKDVCSREGALKQTEERAMNGKLDDRFVSGKPWRDFSEALMTAFKEKDHMVVRGLPGAGAGAGASLIWAVSAIAKSFRTYRNNRIVKHFRMSPWTQDLSHTTRDGHFHTDLNTIPQPPDITGIQCFRPDPAGPGYGSLRVARVREMLDTLEQAGDRRALRFLQETEVEMANDMDTTSWKGRIVVDGAARFHPETVQTAAIRNGADLGEIEPVLDRIHAAAMSVSEDIDLAAGDALIVSNTRALHYRNACTIHFEKFPRQFDSREIGVLHARL